MYNKIFLKSLQVISSYFLSKERERYNSSLNTGLEPVADLGIYF